jgi:hypothetical protein
MQVIRTAFAIAWVLAVLMIGFAPAKLLSQSVPGAVPPPPSPVQEPFSPTGIPAPAVGSPAVSIAPPVVSGPPAVAAVAPSSPQPSRLGLRHPRERGRLRAKLRSILHREN